MSTRYNEGDLTTSYVAADQGHPFAGVHDDSNTSCLVCRPSPEPLSLTPSRPELSWTLISDVHLGAPDVDLQRLDQDLKGGEEDGSRILLGGDLLDLIVPSDSKRYCPSALHPRLHGCTDLAGALADWLYAILKPVAHRIDFMGLGNHEAEYLHRHHHDPLALVHRMLNDSLASWRPKRQPIFYGGMASWVQYQIQTARHSDPQPFNFFYHHGWGRGGGSAAITQFNLLLQRVEGADVFWLGHFHTPLATRLKRLCAPSHDDDALEPVREVHFVRSGAYRKTYCKPQTQAQLKARGYGRNYAAASLMQPQGVGAARVRLRRDTSDPRGFRVIVEA